MRVRLLLIAAVLVLVAASCGAAGSADDAADVGDAATSGVVEFTEIWSREPAAGQPNGVVYGTITNGTDDPLTLTGALVSVETDDTQLHDVIDNDGLMVMQEQENGFTIAPGESLVLEPGGAHVMLLGVDPGTYPDEFEVNFTFDDGATYEAIADVRSITGATDEEDHDHDANPGDEQDHDHGGDAAEAEHDHDADHGDEEDHDHGAEDVDDGDAMEAMEDGEAIEASEASVDGDSAEFELVFADGAIEAGPLHDLDTALRAGEPIDGADLALVAAYVDQLPDAGELPGELIPLLETAEAALEADDAVGAADAVAAAHDMIHDLNHVHS